MHLRPTPGRTRTFGEFTSQGTCLVAANIRPISDKRNLKILKRVWLFLNALNRNSLVVTH